MHRPAVNMVNERVDYISENKGPGSTQTVLHLPEQQADEQMVHEEDAVPFVAVGRLCCSFTHGQQNPLDRNLQTDVTLLHIEQKTEHCDYYQNKKKFDWVTIHETSYRGF